jgi:vacuolar-type H+-ATPase subunit I/STV1
MTFLESLGKWIAQITILALALIPLVGVLQVLFGSVTPFFQSVVTNLLGIIRAFGDGGLIGLIATAIVIWLFSHALRTTK